MAPSDTCGTIRHPLSKENVLVGGQGGGLDAQLDEWVREVKEEKSGGGR